ncbi:MAG: DUF4878 domain-containing protein [Acidimicrobiia bacterium]
MQPQGPEGPQREHYVYPDVDAGAAGAGHARTPEPKGGNNARPWIVVGVAVVVVAALVAVGLFVFGSSSSPKDSANKFLTSIQNGDAAAAYETVSVGMKGRPASEGGTGPLSQWSQTLSQVLAQAGGMKSFTIESVKEDGATATVQYRVVTGLGEESWTMNLVKEDGQWKVDLLNMRSSTYR